MALDLKDVRAKLEPDAHRKLSALSFATGRDMGDLFRDAVDLYIKDEIRKAHAAKVFLRMLGSEGTDGDCAGTAEK